MFEIAIVSYFAFAWYKVIKEESQDAKYWNEKFKRNK